MTATIVFGTDGWRGEIAKDFTFENVSIAAQAIADFINTLKHTNKQIVIGYDTRFLGKEFGQAVAEVFSANGLSCLFSETVLSTPGVARVIKNRGLAGGIMITASHNPGRYNGIKFKAHYAGSADEAMTKEMESFLFKNKIKKIPFTEAVEQGKVTISNLYNEYMDGVRKYADMALLQKQATLTVVVDSMYGAGGTSLAEIMEGSNCKITTIRSEPNPSFPGINPEPILKNLNALVEAVKEKKADLGIATDGDGDRIGAVDEHGNFITPHQLIALLAIHLIENKKMSGKIVRTISSSHLINLVAEKYNLPITETPIGFKHICKLMLEEDILIGGEESGGIGFKDYLPERDGVLSGLLLIELLTIKQKTLGQMIDYLDKTFGKYRYQRIDKHFPNEKKVKALSSLKENPPKEVLGKKVKEVKTYDGVKLILEDNRWLLYRASGTEPLLRIYCEARSEKEVEQFIQKAVEIAEERSN